MKRKSLTGQTENSEFKSLVELLRHRALHQADQRAYTFLVDGETEEVSLTYRELDRQARAIANWLQGEGVTGECVLLLYPPGLEYIAAFFGCLYAGCAAVPAYPPRFNRPMPRLQAIIADARPKVALTISQVLARVERQFPHASAMGALEWLATDTLCGEGIETWQEPAVDRDTLAFLQYTSGSTAMPRGVMVSHGNVLHNQGLIQKIFQHSAFDTVFAGWLPLYHDMGLIGNVLQPLYLGVPCILMSPIAFLQKPVRWLQMISRYRATTSGAPNFAYDLCVRKTTLEQRETLDLSSWVVAFNGAEPVRWATLENFAATFAPHGFRQEAFNPCYGLAEATLMVSGNSKDTLPMTFAVQGATFEQDCVEPASVNDKDSRTLVGCGHTIPDQKIIVVDPESLTRCPSNRVGEIWVSGPSVAQGYWNRPDETRYTFQAYLTDTGEGPFLRTGDLGFMRDGQLFIAGRLKDLIIIHGRNYYPQDIELTVEQSHPALQPGAGAAFSIEVDNEERLVVVQEVRRQHRQPDVDEIARTIRGAVAENFDLLVYTVVLIRIGTIPKTTSGKIQRHACRQQFLADSLSVIGSSILDALYFEQGQDRIELKDAPAVPRTPTEQMLVELWKEVLGLEQFGIHDNFFALGGHSLLATQLVSRIREVFQVELSLRTLFEVPTIAGLARSVDAERGSTTHQIPPIQPILRTDNLPLSFSQERMWFLYQLDPNSAAYHVPLALRLAGSLNVSALEQSFNQVVQRHEVLRTTVANMAGRPVQLISPTLTITLPVIDLQELPRPQREVEVSRLATQEAQRPFDLANGPLTRVILFRLDQEEHVVLVVMHHAVSDAWSLSLLWQEVGSFYAASLTGESSRLPELPVQYVDFAHWQRQWLQGETLENQLAYWQQQLAGAPAVLELPTDRPRPTVQTFRGASQTLALPNFLVEALRQLSRREGVTLFMTLLAAFKVLLYRSTGQEDVLVGTPIANRHWLAIERLIGTFVNTLALRTDLSGNPTFGELLARVRNVALAAYAHQDLPFEQLVEALQPERDLSHSPLVQIMFSVVNPPMSVVDLPNLNWNILDLNRGAAQFDLTLSLVDTKQVQLMSVEYNTDLFECTTIQRMMTHFQVLLESIVTNGVEQRLSELPLLTDAERHQLLVEWNDTAIDYPSFCLHELFETQVARTPDAVAAVFNDSHLTYHELNQRANQLAHYLQTLGVGPEVCVGICVERSLDMLVGVLGILKTGGVYLPLDPTYPMKRLSFMLEDSGSSVLLTQHHLQEDFGDYSGRVVCVDTEWQTIVEHGQSQNPQSGVSPENLAYLIYTSGSTGVPKGVEIPHQAVTNFLLAMQQQLKLVEQDILLAVTTLSFDIAVLELFLPLVNGARVEIVQRGIIPNGVRLIQKLNDSGATVMQATPATYRLLVEAGWSGNNRLTLLCGGEALSRNLANKLLARGACLWNLYGPTETTVWSTSYQVQPGDGPVSIGRAIANTQLYVLDTFLQPVPVGVAGELYIGGTGLARGYHNRPELTIEKFISNPFGDNPQDRLYRTGDLVRYLSDGKLEFLGRIDHQVKLRGFRIELEEIEAVLGQHPAVREVVVVVREDTPGDKRLVAYVVPDRQSIPQFDELRHFGQKQLPDYMVPAMFVTLDALPLTPNGKVDRRALPVPDQVRQVTELFVAPMTDIELRLAQIWSQVLGMDRIGVRDDFFALGGHSLLVTQVMAQVRDTFQIDLPIRVFFEMSTIADLATIIEEYLIAEIDMLTEDQAQRLANSVG